MATPTDDNPFAPPTPSPSREPGARVVSEENPFESALESVPLHAPLDGVSSMPPDAAAVAARERELARREARLAKEELDMSAREAAARALYSDPGSRRKNFPSCFPLLRHDLDDFPRENQPMMRAAHYAWLLTAFAYVWNFFTMTIALLTGVNETSAGDWILAVAFLLFGVPASRYFWHAPLVAAAKRDVSVGRSIAQTAAFSRFFLHFTVHCFVCALFLIAVPFIGTFAAGLFFVVETFAEEPSKKNNANEFVGFLGVGNVLAWSFASAASVWTGRLALRRFRE